LQIEENGDAGRRGGARGRRPSWWSTGTPAVVVRVAAVVEHGDIGRRGRSGSGEDKGVGEERRSARSSGGRGGVPTVGEEAGRRPGGGPARAMQRERRAAAG
jgi:hypothetical protein